MITDPIANFLTKIRNAAAAQKDVVEDSYSKVKHSIANLMHKQGYLVEVEVKVEKKLPRLYVQLNPERMRLSIRRVSKPGQRIYKACDEMKRVKNGLGFGIYSTSRGILSDSEARAAKIGGEYICEIY